ncbi:MAG: hypothetical protein CL670_01075 [Balneola sp.]|jgi:hypothetical protein|nr:hypothetical protein [Balneola sp.]MBE77726.1 hypothetical protein [Balneola sp.]HBX66179.1 hypothetical protein [Balneolaceae bacterium]|tara:strand:- start:1412 stop:2002 length:591 start_codon:yes stop_codon:yes gene_type:complete
MNSEEKKLISRREALKKAALAFGGILSTPAALTLLANCSGPRTSTNRFTDAQRATVETVGDIIIPDTDTAGATKSGAVRIFEDVLFDVLEKDRSEQFLTALGEFEEQAKSDLGVSFISASAEQQKNYIQKIHDEVFGGNIDWDAPRPFIWEMKQAMLNSYFATEVGMTQVMQYQMVPGYFNGCMPFDEAGGKVWAG